MHVIVRERERERERQREVVIPWQPFDLVNVDPFPWFRIRATF